jgi:OOP family OmpA-OmpF porin
MMRFRHRVSLTAALFATVVAGTAAASPNSGEFDIGLFGGYHVFNEHNRLGSEDGDIVGTIDDGPIFGARLTYWLVDRLALEIEGGLFLTNPKNLFDDTLLGYHGRGSVVIRVTPDNLGGDLFLVAGAGIMGIGDSSDDAKSLKSDTDFLPHAGLAAQVELGTAWALRFDAKAFLSKNTDGETQIPYEGTITFVYRMGHKPHAAEPTGPKDGDGDGVPDDTDKCPTEAGPGTADGCPVKDQDGDGINDANDKCPTEAGPGTPDGCPVKDEDGDGIVGDADKCPQQAEDKDGFQDEDGCPDPDNDGDGVADANDKCNDKPETKNGFEDDDGCPDEIPEQVKKFTGAIKGINFVTGKATITKSSFSTLDQAVAVLKEYPSLRIEVAGHTDDVGNDDKNMTLSQARADSVKAYLTSKGVEEARIKAVGYGETKPVDPAKSKAARAKNRRVEFTILTE